MKPLLIGQAPSRNGEGKSAFSAESRGSGRKLAALFGVGSERLLDVFEMMNVFAHWLSKQGKGDAFPLQAAREKMANFDCAGRIVVLVGKNVAKAFGLNNIVYFEWRDVRNGRGVVIPHPSGVNKWWNDEQNRREAGRFFKRFRERCLDKNL